MGPSSAATPGGHRTRHRQIRRASGAPPWHAPYFVAFDALQMAATARGAVRERVMVI